MDSDFRFSNQSGDLELPQNILPQTGWPKSFDDDLLPNFQDLAPEGCLPTGRMIPSLQGDTSELGKHLGKTPKFIGAIAPRISC